MLITTILTILCFLPKAHSDQFVDHILNKVVNNSVKPCDDFFRHVCGIDSSDDLTTFVEPMLDNELKNLTVFDETSEYLVELIKCQNASHPDGKFADQLKEQFNAACKNGTEKQFLVNLKNIFPNEINVPFISATCEKHSELDFILLGVQNDLMQVECKNIMGNVTEWLWMYRNNETIEKMRNVFDRVKTVYQTWVRNTPWIKNNNVTESYELKIKSVHFNGLQELEYIKTLADVYSSCKKNLTWIDHVDLVKTICSYKAYAYRKPARGFIDIRVNAGNRGGAVSIGLPFFAIASKIDSTPFFMGHIGNIIAHEIAHSIIQGNNEEQRVFFSKPTHDCIQKQFEKSCSVYKEGYCTVTETRFDDNGSDFLGSRAIFQHLIDEMGETLFEKSKKYMKMTNIELFFYGQSSTLCIKSLGSGGDDHHSPSDPRFNSIAVQNSHFQNAFECDPESKMIKSLHEKCHILGAEASLQKK